MERKYIALFIFIVNAHAVTITEVQQRIGAELQFIDNQVALVKMRISKGIEDLRTTLNTRAENIRVEISTGPLNCKIFNEQLVSIQEFQIGSANEFLPCLMKPNIDVTDTYRKTVEDARVTATLIAALCTPTATNATIAACESQANLLSRSLDTVHTSMVNQINNIDKAFNNNCIYYKRLYINYMLDDAQNAWKSCQ